MKNYSPYQFAVFRIYLGLYLLVHFLYLLPWSLEVYGSGGAGMILDPKLNWSYGFLPNILVLSSIAPNISAVVILMALLSIMFLLGISRKPVAILLWYGWACLLNLNNLTSTPAVATVGWILLASVFVPYGEPWSVYPRQEKNTWQMPPAVYCASWVVFSLSYSFSGYIKLFTPSWIDGSTTYHVLGMVYARSWWITKYVRELPMGFHNFFTWSMLFFELCCAPAALFRFGRAFFWWGLTAMHLGLLVLYNIPDVTLGVLAWHVICWPAIRDNR